MGSKKQGQRGGSLAVEYQKPVPSKAQEGFTTKLNVWTKLELGRTEQAPVAQLTRSFPGPGVGRTISGKEMRTWIYLEP